MTTILYLHNTAAISGGERSLLELWRGLDRKRFTPVLIVPGPGPLEVEARKLDVRVEFLSVPGLRPWTVVQIWQALAALIRIIRQQQVSVVHSYTPRNNVLACLAVRWVNIISDRRTRGKIRRTVVIWHERNLLFGLEPDISRWLLSWPEAVICNSFAVARRFEIKGRLPDHVKVIHNGVDVSCFQYWNPAASSAFLDASREVAKAGFGWSGAEVVGVVSNLNRRKGVELFLDVAGRLSRSKDHRRVFVVVGGEFGTPGSQRLDELHRRVVRMGLKDQVVFTGFQQDVRPYLQAMDVLCAVTRQEACSRAILEAMATGLPVVAVEEGGNPELVEHAVSGTLVQPGRVNLFAKAVEVLLNDAALRERYGKAARARVERLFDVRLNTLAVCRVYDSLSPGK